MSKGKGKNHNYITKDTQPELKAYGMSNKIAVIFCIMVLTISSVLFLITIFCDELPWTNLIRPAKMISSLYMALLGGLASMVTLRKISVNTEYKIAHWECIWRRCFLVITACIAVCSIWMNDRWWEVAQFYGYGLASYFVGCWLGTDTRKPKEKSK